LEKAHDYLEEGANNKASSSNQVLLAPPESIRWHVATPECGKVKKSYTFLVCKEYVWKNSRK
jgi:hypothetical protein